MRFRIRRFVFLHNSKRRIEAMMRSSPLCCTPSFRAGVHESPDASRHCPLTAIGLLVALYARPIYAVVFRAAIGLWVNWPPHPTTSPRMGFLFVEPVRCLHLPSDSAGGAQPRGGRPWCSAIPFPLPGRFGTFTRWKCALPGAPTKNPRTVRSGGFPFLLSNLRRK